MAADNLFRLIDADGNGYIEAKELHDYLVHHGHDAHPFEDLVEMMQGADQNGDGRISIKEFRRYVFHRLRLCAHAY